MKSGDMNGAHGGQFDVIIVGGGIGGIYAAYRLSQMGLSFAVLEAASDVGGTWFWNRYPGARCDLASLDYSYSFSPELEQEWDWTEQYATQPEILSYIKHVVERFDLRKYFIFNARVERALFEQDSKRWTLTTAEHIFSARYVIMATGLLSTPIDPDIPGLADFTGECYFASRWPHHPVDFAGKKVGVIGTGSSGMQIIQEIATKVGHLKVFQRTANYSVPAANSKMDGNFLADYRARYREIRAAERKSPLGHYWSAFEANPLAGKDLSEEERRREFEARWQQGGQTMMVAFSDLTTDLEVNKSCADFIRSKISAVVKDPAKRQALLPPEEESFACKRLCVDVGYFEVFNQDNVAIVDIRKDPIVTIEPTGVRTAAGLHGLDMLILATGFDAFTGALGKIDIRGRGNVALKDKWEGAPASYLGVITAGFPNMFLINGPFCAVGNVFTTTEMLVDRIIDLMRYAEKIGAATIDTSVEEETAWRDTIQDQAKGVPTMHTCKSWFTGANVPGKKVLVLIYLGGLAAYHECWDDVVQNGYRGFTFADIAEPFDG